MKSADLPKEKAFEPNEGAHQPLLQNNMDACYSNQTTPKKLSFAKTADVTEVPSSQTNCSYQNALSQPMSTHSHSQRLLWLQKRRTAGLWAQCDSCDRWRYLPNIIDRYELPKKWYCYMNPDPDFATCSVPEAPLRVQAEENLIHSEYNAGSLVWARLSGWPWWPAMVDDCPDAEQFYWLDGFSDIPTHYNVVFFDSTDATRSWISPENLKPYSLNKKHYQYVLKNKKFGARLRAAVSQANEAENMALEQRLNRFSFLNRHMGKINSPKKINKTDLQKYQKQFKRKFNVEFPIESSDSDEDTIESVPKNKNVIMLGTPKRLSKERKSISVKRSQQDSGNEVVDLTIEDKKKKRVTITETQISGEDELVININNPTNSMVVQIENIEVTFDNDTSTTYLPDQESQLQNLSTMIETPNSDDFDF